MRLIKGEKSVKTRFLGYLLVALGLVVSSGNSVAAYTLTRIVDDSGQFAAFSGPSINNNGTVCYQAILNDGVQGIYTGTGTKIIDSTGLFVSFGTPSINDNNTVSYQAVLDSGVSGIYENAGSKVVDSNGAFSSLAIHQSIISIWWRTVQ